MLPEGTRVYSGRWGVPHRRGHNTPRHGAGTMMMTAGSCDPTSECAEWHLDSLQRCAVN